MRICVISFSGRKGGNCAQIGRRLQALLPQVQYFDFSEFSLHPCGGCSYECFQGTGACPWSGDMEHTLLDAVVHSELAYFVIPNYCDRPCANFFLFDERSQCLFQHQPDLADAYIQVPKKFFVVSNTEQETFRTLLVSHTIGPPDILFLSASHYGKISIAGDLLSSAQAAADVDAFAQTT